jgi:hypothetical protein
MSDLRIYSATSDDGRVFSVDDGFRIEPLGTDGVYDPAALQTAAGCLLIAGPDGAYAGIADDGLSFPEPVQFTADDRPFHAWAGVALPEGNGYRLYGYFTEPPRGFTTVYSPDGASWLAEDGFSLTGGIATDVGVTVLPGGTFLMAYLDVIPE